MPEDFCLYYGRTRNHSQAIVDGAVLGSGLEFHADNPLLVNVWSYGSVASAADCRATHSMERRKTVRYRLAASVVFSWDGPEDTPMKGEGFTRDIGRGGVFVFTAVCPAVNSFVRLQILLHLIDGRTDAIDGRLPDIDFDGKVLRVEHLLSNSISSGFALAATKVSLDREVDNGTDF